MSRTAVEARIASVIDFFKQTITLSSAAIVVVASFIDKMATARYVRWSVKAALVCFVIAVASGLLAMFSFSVGVHSDEPKAEPLLTRLSSILGLFAITGFLCGLIGLAVFVCYNF
jgi:hypothetical protein